MCFSTSWLDPVLKWVVIIWLAVFWPVAWRECGHSFFLLCSFPRMHKNPWIATSSFCIPMMSCYFSPFVFLFCVMAGDSHLDRTQPTAISLSSEIPYIFPPKAIKCCCWHFLYSNRCIMVSHRGFILCFPGLVTMEWHIFSCAYPRPSLYITKWGAASFSMTMQYYNMGPILLFHQDPIDGSLCWLWYFAVPHNAAIHNLVCTFLHICLSPSCTGKRDADF